ncbi:hypothetical protein NLI96_g9625 [Meripilus lineatus]|uniref:U1-type domain-containing protein n=1 Tax=Meripilus lineatus TaxID=2056292 RepID=A0AAD5YCR4_9APHY|nr:hypothetical protein NLI96_g9625 [Physisporinus lineatus]
MDSIIEVQRQTHEEIEHFERALYTVLSRPQQTHETRLQTDHKAAQILDRISSRVATLNGIYQDQNSRKTEIDALSTNPNDLTEFYSRLRKIQEHYAKYPDSVASGFDLELAAFLDDGMDLGEDEEYEQDDPIALMFSGEEQYGKYLDLYANHTAYNNLKNIGKRLPYLQYLDVLLAAQSTNVHSELSKDCRLSRDYELYIKALHTYLLSFTKRAQPLVDIESQQRESEAAFEKQWAEGDNSEWIDSRLAKENGGEEGIWCSACQKMYSKQTVYDAHLSSKKHIKATAKQANSEQPPTNPNGPAPSHSTGNGTTPNQPQNKHRTAAMLTFLTTKLLASLVPVLNETKSNVERRFSLTAREREQELLEQSKPKPAVTPAAGASGEAGADEEEEEERIYNPLKLPLGWDGKPIPYWLYKLHGLGMDLTFVPAENSHKLYFGDQEKLRQAFPVAEKLKREGRNEIFEQETMEELEDEEGNVYNRKTYEDLKKQGLI